MSDVPQRSRWRPVVVMALIVAAAWLILRRADPEPPSARLDEADLIGVVSRGERVSLANHVSEKGWTVVEFTADW